MRFELTNDVGFEATAYTISATLALCSRQNSNLQSTRSKRVEFTISSTRAFLSLQLELHQHQQFRRLLSLSVRRWRRFNTFTSLFSGLTTRFIKVASFYFFCCSRQQSVFSRLFLGVEPDIGIEPICTICVIAVRANCLFFNVLTSLYYFTALPLSYTRFPS